MPNLWKLFKKSPAEPLPGFPAISPNDLRAGDALLFYGGVKLTELFGNRVYGHPYSPPAFHAALALSSQEFLNVGKFKTIESIQDEFRSTRRIDVIRYDMATFKREILEKNARKDVDGPKVGQLPTYAFTDYLRFGLKWFKPSKKDFCSENVVEHLQAVGCESSHREPYNTAPWHLLEFALERMPEVSVRTLWVGPDFKR